MKCLKFILLLTVSLQFCVYGRTWTDQQGRTFDGDFVELVGDDVKIMRSGDRHVFEVSISKLSEPDRKHLATISESTSVGAKGKDVLGNTTAFEVEKFRVSLDNMKHSTAKARLKYNHRTVWEGNLTVPGPVELVVDVETDFDEEPKKGYSRSDRIYLYIEHEDHATQWHVLEKSGDMLKFTDSKRIKLYKKKFALIEYEFYQGDDTDFEGRDPTHSGIAAVGHWGNLPGFGHDWQIWQGSSDEELWGKTLLLEHHRGNSENGMRKARSSDFSRMDNAPETGYVHYGSCGKPSLAAKAGQSYYCRVTGHTESTRGYGKISIKDIVEKVPEGVEIFER